MNLFLVEKFIRKQSKCCRRQLVEPDRCCCRYRPSPLCESLIDVIANGISWRTFFHNTRIHDAFLRCDASCDCGSLFEIVASCHIIDTASERNNNILGAKWKIVIDLTVECMLRVIAVEPYGIEVCGTDAKTMSKWTHFKRFTTDVWIHVSGSHAAGFVWFTTNRALEWAFVAERKIIQKNQFFKKTTNLLRNLI